ncbi:MATE family efflux transporter [Holdemanella porci]|uniref:MATE family efflux transporter n=1 Tax=Holdemanella porci TaxID=2652276 RepID=UPI003AF03A34
MYTKEQLRRLLIPLMFEQVLTALMGSVDTIMVTNIGSAAISAVSLVDSLNILIINIFAAMATGGAIICAQYLGSNQKDKANQALKQLIFSVTLISILITIPCILFRRPLLSLIFGSVEKKRDGQFIKLSFHHRPILSLYRSI